MTASRRPRWTVLQDTREQRAWPLADLIERHALRLFGIVRGRVQRTPEDGFDALAAIEDRLGQVAPRG